MHIQGYDHFGIRVTDRDRALAFYQALGFRIDSECSTARVAEVVNMAGIRLNLIFNGQPHPGGNILLDEPVKWPGYTHAAFTVERLDDVLAWASAHGVRITEGPVDWGRRLTCFLRDPDQNVLEFNELKSDAETEACPPYRLILGEKNYSSWSMRAWLLLRHLDVPFDETTVPLYRSDSRAAVQAHGGETGLVPVLRDGDLAVWDTLALFEYLQERHGGVWPAEPAARARARSLAGELHSGFTALRAAMPANTRARNRLADITPPVQADIDRVADLWARLPSPWLFGDFCGADIMFAPVACRFQTYGVVLDGAASIYQEQLLTHPLVVDWLALGAAETNRIEDLERPSVVV